MGTGKERKAGSKRGEGGAGGGGGEERVKESERDREQTDRQTDCQSKRQTETDRVLDSNDQFMCCFYILEHIAYYKAKN